MKLIREADPGVVSYLRALPPDAKADLLNFFLT